MASEVITTSPHSLYESTLSSEVSKTATEIKPVSIGEFQDGDIVYFTLEPKTSRAELARGTWVAANSQFESCLRGLRLYGSATEVTANKEKHGRGTKIIVSDSHLYVQEIKDVINNIAEHEAVANLTALNAVTGMGTYDRRFVQDLATTYYYDGANWQPQTTGSVSTATASTFGTVKVLDAPVGDAIAITTDNTTRLLSVADKTDLTDAGDSALHYHATDRDRANHTGTQASSTISDFDEASQDAIDSAISAGTHTALSSTYDDGGNSFSFAVLVDDSGIEVSGSNKLQLKDDGIKNTHVDWGTGAGQVSLDDVVDGSTYSRFTTVQVTDLTDSGDSALHYHATDRDRSNHTGTQALSTVSDLTATASEINQALDGISGNVTDTNLNLVTGGSNADSLHSHDQYLPKVFTGTAGESVDGSTTPQLVFVSDSTGSLTAGRYYKTDMNNPAEARAQAVGFVTGTKTAGQTDSVIFGGVVDGFTGLTAGAEYYASTSAGTISTTRSGIKIGRAISTTQILIDKVQSQRKMGTDSFAPTSASDTKTVTHNLGVLPAYIKIRWGDVGHQVAGEGIYDVISGTYATVSEVLDSNQVQAGIFSADTSHIIDSDNNPTKWNATVSSVGVETFELDVDTFVSVNSISFRWEVGI